MRNKAFIRGTSSSRKTATQQRMQKIMTKKMQVTTCEIAGAQYAGSAKQVMALEYAETVNLVAEKDNRYDSNAVRIENQAGEKLGYVPKGCNGTVSRMLAEGAKIWGEVIQKDKDANHLRSVVQIAIYCEVVADR